MFSDILQGWEKPDYISGNIHWCCSALGNGYSDDTIRYDGLLNMWRYSCRDESAGSALDTVESCLPETDDLFRKNESRFVYLSPYISTFNFIRHWEQSGNNIKFFDVWKNLANKADCDLFFAFRSEWCI